MNKSLILVLLFIVGCANGPAQETPEVFPEVIPEPEPLEVGFKYQWLSVGNFQKLTTNEQNAIMVATHDTIVLSRHTMGRHNLENCVSLLTRDELESIRNTALEMEEDDKRYGNSVIAGVAQLSMGLCNVSQQQRPESKSEHEKEAEKTTEGPI